MVVKQRLFDLLCIRLREKNPSPRLTAHSLPIVLPRWADGQVGRGSLLCAELPYSGKAKGVGLPWVSRWWVGHLESQGQQVCPSGCGLNWCCELGA